jgi:hypothetical protein
VFSDYWPDSRFLKIIFILYYEVEMSDSEDDERVTKLNFKKDRIHFGSLEEAKPLSETPKPVSICSAVLLN